MNCRTWITTVLLVLLGLVATPVGALAVMFTYSSGSLSASVTFEQSGSNLLVTLTNNSTADVLAPTDVLTAVFFTLPDDPMLTTISAVVPTGSDVLFGGTDSGGVVGGEWAYKNNLVGAPFGADGGISSAGLGLFGPGDLFPPMVNLQGPLSPGGLQYGITSAGDNPDTGNSAVTGGFALIKNSVVFTLSGLTPGYLNDETVTNVSFQYGTSLRDPNVSVPEPGTLVLLGSGLAGIAALGWRSRSRTKGHCGDH